MPFDLKAFLRELKEAGNLSDEQVQNLEPILGVEGALKYLDGRLLMQADYSRKTQALAETKKQYDAAIEQSEQLSNLLEDIRKRPDTSAAELQQVRSQLAQTQANLVRLHSELYRYDQGREAFDSLGWNDVSKIMGGSSNGDPKGGSLPNNGNGNHKPPAEIDLDKIYAEAEKRVTERLMPLINRVAEWPVDFQFMRDRYYSLTGKRLDPQDFKKTVSAKMKEMDTNDPFQAFNAAYEIPKLEREKEFEGRLAAERKKWQEEADANRQREALSRDGHGVADESSEIYKLLDQGEPKAKVEEKQLPANGDPSKDWNTRAGYQSYAEEAQAALAEVRGQR